MKAEERFVRMYCRDCRMWGTPFPERCDKQCGNCGSTNTDRYVREATLEASEALVATLADALDSLVLAAINLTQNARPCGEWDDAVAVWGCHVSDLNTAWQAARLALTTDAGRAAEGLRALREYAELYERIEELVDDQNYDGRTTADCVQALKDRAAELEAEVERLRKGLSDLDALLGPHSGAHDNSVILPAHAIFARLEAELKAKQPTPS